MAGAAVIATAAVLAVLVTAGLEKRHDERVVSVRGVVDTFDRADAAELGAVPRGPRWASTSGRWGVAGHQAALLEPAGDASVAAVDLGSGDGSAEVRVATVVTGAGLVFRYRGPNDFWSVVALPFYGTWTVVRRIGGQSTAVASTGLSPVGDGVTLAVTMKGSEEWLQWGHGL